MAQRMQTASESLAKDCTSELWAEAELGPDRTEPAPRGLGGHPGGRRHGGEVSGQNLCCSSPG